MMNSMLGALVGDAAGATLEFCHRKITNDMALKAMKMPGGGNIGVGPGQITDDGELTLTLWRFLNSSETIYPVPVYPVPILTLMRGYKDWYDSVPFDIGRTCSLAFEAIYDFLRGHNIYTLESCKDTIKIINKDSEANGALMRATAIATWIVTTPSTNIKMGIEYAKEDAQLSHPSIVCQEVNAIYVFSIINLLQGKTPGNTLELTNNFVNSEITSEKVKLWYFNESIDITNIDATRQIGHVRWGFIMAIYFLRNPDISYEDSIRITLMKGGDTDTNAAIVGGMVGAYNKIPEYMLKAVLDFDCTIEGRHHKRPDEYSVKKVIGHLI
jgi:ADP-ribosyl-[dinitrogen reductase] hydrolase